MLIELAARAGVALDNAVLYGSERRLALTLQRSLLPAEIPDVPGIELATRYLPATGGRDVGGDFYIAHPLEDGRVLLVIGDVMGHGAQAAARMGQLRAVLAAYAYDGDPPDRVLAHLSVRAPTLLDLPMATVLAAVYDPETRQLTFSLAGHLPPLIVPRDGELFFVETGARARRWAQEAREYARHLARSPACDGRPRHRRPDRGARERDRLRWSPCARARSTSTSRRTRRPTRAARAGARPRAATTTSRCSS